MRIDDLATTSKCVEFSDCVSSTVFAYRNGTCFKIGVLKNTPLPYMLGTALTPKILRLVTLPNLAAPSTTAGAY